MKDKILYLIIGFLIGTIVATSAFLIYNKTLKTNLNGQEIMQMNRDGQSEPPSKPKGDNGEELPSMQKQNEGTSSKMLSNSNNNNV